MLLTAAVTALAARDVPLRNHVSFASCSSQGVKLCPSERRPSAVLWLQVDAEREQMEATFRSSACRLEMLRTVIFPFVLCGCETWSVAVQEEHGLRVFEGGC
jgi:hypothetical protein